MVTAKSTLSQTGKAVQPVSSGFDTDSLWLEKTELIKRFINQRTDYEKLCAEAAYILNRELSKIQVEFSSITHRAKTLNSFLEKIQRKAYRDPIAEITDFAGVRVVCLYNDDLTKVEKAITEHFDILEKIDKLTTKKTDQFGYGAIHFVVRLGKNSSGARYDDLKNLVCEIQTRTVLQDAWAIIDHHLIYKNESNIPTVLKSRLNLLAENFQIADDEFKSIRAEREEYLTGIKESETDSKLFLENELNLDSFVRYAQWKFPELPSGEQILDIPFFLKPLTEMNLKKLSDLDAIVERGANEFNHYAKANGNDFLTSYSITSVALSALLVNREFTPEHIKIIFPKYSEFLDMTRLKT